ncbi:5-bromo-4-chloroindolyl phosphate hydrolysis family protein [Pseudoroseicyclus aestuarii]|uniref:5-bromo-4-chloroindolyl phosphate hydrolysis protein n=1 Tax=Pseudoroseicyclus aestuarii TaxID=1795041 RepID=A0A318SMI0_9RHOB|nr:5-bromo-4-chloroindolyl phosphate hydrolysis family protein [Pseudoroseicyclus aestuarii]PYE81271.1 5-bromo-4-chloroindolyl phosphate hydrolysis protein [Pseudoroseicyclus aestuarii]
MARRFGGRYSPGARGADAPLQEAALREARVDAAGTKANLLFVPPAVLAVASLGAGPAGLLAGLVGAGAMALAAWLLRHGLRAEAAYAERPAARRPALPRKMLASGLTGIGVALAGWSGDAGVIGAVLYGIAATGLHVAAFGIDPLRDKRIEGVDAFQQDRVARVIDEAETYLAQMRESIAVLGNRRLDSRVLAFQGRARAMIRAVQEDPRELAAARRYLGVYLMGARDASQKFAQLWPRSRDTDALRDYEQLLTDLETGFTQRTEALLESDRTALDIEMNVLRDRLAQDGVETR